MHSTACTVHPSIAVINTMAYHVQSIAVINPCTYSIAAINTMAYHVQSIAVINPCTYSIAAINTVPDTTCRVLQ
jgi:hypothetical protein